LRSLPRVVIARPPLAAVAIQTNVQIRVVSQFEILSGLTVWQNRLSRPGSESAQKKKAAYVTAFNHGLETLV
jgi:hypothetical protein